MKLHRRLAVLRGMHRLIVAPITPFSIRLWGSALLVLLALAACRADDTPQPTLPVSTIAKQMAAIHPKTVVFVFDVSESTRANDVFSNERAATSELLREGCLPGDHVALLSFGTSYRTIFDETVGTPTNFDVPVSQLPGDPEPGHGTNIRLPHHAALKIVESSLPNPGVIVLLTDSFNDRPLDSDPAYAQYLQYYALDSLTHYPHTPENREYAALLARLMRSGKLHEYGVTPEAGHVILSGSFIKAIPLDAGDSVVALFDTLGEVTFHAV